MLRKKCIGENIEIIRTIYKPSNTFNLLLIVLFSLAGIPPLAVFAIFIFMAVIKQSMYFLAIVGLYQSNSTFIFKINKIIYFDIWKVFETDHNIGLKFTLAISTGILVLYFIYPSALIELVSRIVLI